MKNAIYMLMIIGMVILGACSEQEEKSVPKEQQEDVEQEKEKVESEKQKEDVEQEDETAQSEKQGETTERKEAEKQYALNGKWQVYVGQNRYGVIELKTKDNVVTGEYDVWIGKFLVKGEISGDQANLKLYFQTLEHLENIVMNYVYGQQVPHENFDTLAQQLHDIKDEIYDGMTLKLTENTIEHGSYSMMKVVLNEEKDTVVDVENASLTGSELEELSFVELTEDSE